MHLLPMQCVEHVAAQLITILRAQKPDFAPFLPPKIAFSDPPGPVFCTRKVSDFQGNILIGFGHLRDYLQLCHSGNNYDSDKI